MGIEVSWDNDSKTILRYVYSGRWTWGDLDKVRDQAATLEASVPHRVDVIVDVENSSLLPSGTISRARQVATSAPTTHPNEGITIIVGAGAFVRSIYDVMAKVYPEMLRRRGIFFAQTLAEARDMIAKHSSAPSTSS
jgi:hypothetical protein